MEQLKILDLSQIEFTIPKESYYGSSPISRIYASNEGNWSWSGTDYKSFYQDIKVNITFSEANTVTNIDTGENISYKRGIKIEWKKGNYIGEKESTVEENKIITISFSSSEDSPLLFTDDSNSITFKVYSFYENNNSRIYQEKPVLDFSKDSLDPNNFFISKKPRIYTNGTTIPSLNGNFTRNVDFFEGIITNGNDYQLDDIRVETVSDIPIYGFKVYVTLDGVSYANKQIISTKGYFKQKGIDLGVIEVKEGDIIKDNIYKLNELLPSKDNFSEISFNSMILNNNQSLKNLIGGNSLETLNNTQTFYYIISAVNILKQESEINYILKTDYDFRLNSFFQENPLLKNSGFILDPVDNTRYLFHGQANNEYDWITFEWYPAISKNDYLINKGRYKKFNDKIYLIKAEDDPNNYILHKWIDGKTKSQEKNLILGYDYKIVEEKLVDSNNNELLVPKYIGRYALGLTDINISEIFNLTLSVSYLDRKDSSDFINNTLKNDDGSSAKFFLSRFVTPKIIYDSHDREKGGNNFLVNLKIINYEEGDWGGRQDIAAKDSDAYRESNGVIGSSAKMNLSNSTLSEFISVEEKFINPENPENSVYGKKLLTFDFKDYKDKIYDNMPFTTSTEITVEIYRFLLSKDDQYSIDKTSSSIKTIYTYFIPPFFATLSLRKNKVGINYSDLTHVEEALYVVAKDRVDAINKIGNIAVYENTYPHVLSIQGNSETKMPNFDKATGEALTSNLQKASIYMGFYTVNEKNEPYRVGSFGIEEGKPYFVYKGKYNEKDGTEIGKNGIIKKYDNKDYFEKISIMNLPVPPGTLLLFPQKNILTNGQLDQEKISSINNTWFICNGQPIYPENNANLILALYGKEALNEDGSFKKQTFTVPHIYPDLRVQIPKKDANGELLDPIELETVKNEDFCYIIKGDA